jgi:hypothetical protein
MPTDTHPLQDQCDAPAAEPSSPAAEPSSQQTAQRDRARRSLAAELAPECPTGEPIQELPPLPDAPAPSVPRDAGMAPVAPSEPPPLWENYSRCELWQLYAAANATALTRGAEVDRLKRFGDAQQATAQTTLTQAGDEYNRLLLIETEKSTTALAGQAETFKTELAGRLQAYARQLQTNFAAQQVTLRAAHDAEKVTLRAAHDAEIATAKGRYSDLQHEHEETKGLWKIAIAGAAAILIALYWNFH